MLGVKDSNIDSLSTNFAYLNKGGIAAAIQRLRIFSGSQLLCDIDNYGNLIETWSI